MDCSLLPVDVERSIRVGQAPDKAKSEVVE
jgi:hypothetical protein